MKNSISFSATFSVLSALSLAACGAKNSRDSQSLQSTSSSATSKSVLKCSAEGGKQVLVSASGGMLSVSLPGTPKSIYTDKIDWTHSAEVGTDSSMPHHSEIFANSLQVDVWPQTKVFQGPQYLMLKVRYPAGVGIDGKPGIEEFTANCDGLFSDVADSEFTAFIAAHEIGALNYNDAKTVGELVDCKGGYSQSISYETRTENGKVQHILYAIQSLGNDDGASEISGIVSSVQSDEKGDKRSLKVVTDRFTMTYSWNKDESKSGTLDYSNLTKAAAYYGPMSKDAMECKGKSSKTLDTQTLAKLRAAFAG